MRRQIMLLWLLLAIAASLPGCSWARHRRVHVTTPTIETRRMGPRQHYKITMRDGTTRRAVMDENGVLRYADLGPDGTLVIGQVVGK